MPPGILPTQAQRPESPAAKVVVLRASLLGVFLCLGAVTGMAASPAPGGPEDPVNFFERRVRPILIEKCYDCHSTAHKVKGGLQLDSKAGWEAGGDSGPAIVPHDPEASLFMRAVGYGDRDLKMPPKEKLGEAEIAVFRQWIEQGAPDPRSGPAPTEEGHAPKVPDVATGRSFWSFQLPRKHEPPPVRDAAWPATGSDRFILSRLEQEQLRPAPDASWPVLVRRLYFDLVGLPPAPEDLEAFETALRNAPPGSILPYERLADTLLASPRFGERWGRHWLDITRFAESSGGGRTLPFKDAWRYRDYVIDAINNDLPLDRFITEQLAGDLLPSASAAERRRHLTATGFLVLGPTNYEEQDKQVLRMDIVDEQMDTMGRAFLGMTLSCARCHDHKFDPVPARDYYALAGIFRSTRTLRNYTDNVAHWIDSPLPMEGEIETALQAHEAVLARLTEDLAKAKQLLKKYAPKDRVKDAKARPVAVDELPGIVVDDTAARKVGDWKHSTRYPTFVGEGYLHDEDKDKGAKTLTFAPKIERSGRYEVWLSYMALQDRSEAVPVTVLHADGEETIKVDQTAVPPINGRFVSLGQYRFVAGGEGFVLLSNEGTTGHVTADAVVFVPVDDLKSSRALTADTADERDKDPRLVEAEKQVKRLENELREARNSPLSRPEAMTVLEDEKPADTRVHIRGSIRNLGAVAPRGVLSVALHEPPPVIPENESGRRQLAAWVVSERNPLTARVLVNRVWMWLHGEGLVRTVDNFGATGETPSHPELLDTLAVEFMEDGWSLKRLVKRLVMSRTYRMASGLPVAGPDGIQPQEVDPDNRLRWRQNRRRMDAESLRDTILTLAGSIEHRLGGPNVNAGVVDANDGGAQNLEYNYVYKDTRRSVYTPAFRNKRLELFDTFDFADINGPVGKRSASTVAPQALYFMNHPFIIEQSGLAAARLLASGEDDATLADRAFVAALGRPPTPRERGLALDFLQTSASDPDPAAHRRRQWALFVQTLFGSVDFRHIN